MERSRQSCDEYLGDSQFTDAHSALIKMPGDRLTVHVQSINGKVPVLFNWLRDSIQYTIGLNQDIASQICLELYYRGVDVRLVLGGSSLAAPDFIPQAICGIYAEYKEICLQAGRQCEYDSAIFSAAVADYEPVEEFAGKIKRNSGFDCINLKPVEKIIDPFREVASQTRLISFKYEENVSLEELISIGKDRLESGHLAVICNRGRLCQR
ncbi:MAG: phosphopantothenoylcysteine synthetase/decarboxylase [Gammaproteobacteria bacterium]